MTGAEGAAALQNRPIRFLLDVDVWLDWNRLPVAHRIYSDLLIVRATAKLDSKTDGTVIHNNKN